MYQTVSGLTIRSVNYRESDQILTVLTEDRGLLTVKARGTRRKESRTRAASQLFTLSRMTLFEQRGRFVLHEAEILQQFPGLSTSLTSLSLASYFAEVLGTEAEDSPASPEVLRLALNCLYALSHGLCPERAVKAAFELRYMALAGYSPALDRCCVCGRADIPAPRVMLAAGTVRCGSCPAPGQGGAEAILSPASLDCARYLLSCDLKKLFSFRLAEEELSRLGRFTERYLLTCMEREFRTLDFYKNVGDT